MHGSWIEYVAVTCGGATCLGMAGRGCAFHPAIETNPPRVAGFIVLADRHAHILSLHPSPSRDSTTSLHPFTLTYAQASVASLQRPFVPPTPAAHPFEPAGVPTPDVVLPLT